MFSEQSLRKQRSLRRTQSAVENNLKCFDFVDYSKISKYLSVTTFLPLLDSFTVFWDNLLLATSDLFPVLCKTQFHSFLTITCAVQSNPVNVT